MQTTGARIPTRPDVAAGAAVYSKALLAVYDLIVLGFELPIVFRCPARRVLELYDAHASDTHLDVGVGTGWFLDRCRFPVARPVIHLADLNPNCLERTSRRIRRHAPVTHVWNAFEPFGDAAPRFGSIGLSNFLHCLPGSMLEKEPVIRNLRPLLREGGVLFGSTVLGRGVDHVGALYRATNRAYNRKSIFCNADDGAAELERILAGSFARQSVRIAGAMALFTAHA